MYNNQPSIFAISGSTKQRSSNKTLLEHLKKSFPDVVFDFYEGVDRLPHFNPDVEGSMVPGSVVDFRKRIENADGVIICTPEYVFNLPGSLKNALDWLVSTTVLTNKPVAQIIASASGEKAYELLHLILTTLQARVSDETRLLVQGVKGKVDGDKIKDHEVKSSLNKIMKALLGELSE